MMRGLHPNRTRGRKARREGGGILTHPRDEKFIRSVPEHDEQFDRASPSTPLTSSEPSSRLTAIRCALCMRLIEKPAGGEKQLTWDIYFNYNVSAYYAENAGDVHMGACGAGDGGCVSGAPRGGKCEKMALSPPGADGPQIKWGGSPRRQYETDLSTQEETEKQSARFP